ncbi:MAG: transcriptional repressor [Clostridia bacterium]|nr:transcriptional repressor [Clostridia bacterium]
MPVKSHYHTRQREELLDFLREHRGEHFTAAQLKAHFDGGDAPLGAATIYRHMDKLAREGLVRRYQLDSGDSACYEYVGLDPAGSGAAHFHCKCEKCGALIHLDCDELQSIKAHLLEHHGFQWNAGRTVFYGICDQCLKTA